MSSTHRQLGQQPFCATPGEVRFDESERTLELRRGNATLRLDFANETVELDA